MPKQQNISEGLNEIIGYVPNWIARFGSILSLIVISILVLVASFIKYPNVYNAKGFISGGSGPVVIHSPTSGYLHLLVKNGSNVQQNQPVAYLESQTKYSSESKKIHADSIILLKVGGYEDWEDKRLVTSPIAGKLTYLDFFSEGYYAKSEQQIFGISSKDFTNLEAKVYLPISVLKQIEADYKVQVSLSDFPENKNISIIGKVDSISTFPTADPNGKPCYLMIVKLENDSLNNHKEALMKYDYWGVDVKIISNDVSLLKRILSGTY